MKTIRHNHRLLFGLILVMFFTPFAWGDNTASDAEKINTVYQMYAGYKKEFPDVEDISPRKAMTLLEQDAVVFIDTRKPAEMAVSTLPGAVTREEFIFNRDRYAGKTAIAFCTIGYRSGLFARDMASIGRKVANLRGSILAWTLEGGTVVDEQGEPTRRVHVYGDKWDYAPEDWESVKFSRWEQIF